MLRVSDGKLASLLIDVLVVDTAPAMVHGAGVETS